MVEVIRLNQNILIARVTEHYVRNQSSNKISQQDVRLVNYYISRSVVPGAISMA